MNIIGNRDIIENYAEIETSYYIFYKLIVVPHYWAKTWPPSLSISQQSPASRPSHIIRPVIFASACPATDTQKKISGTNRKQIYKTIYFILSTHFVLISYEINVTITE